MDVLKPIQMDLLVLPPLAAVVLLLLWWAGPLRRRSLDKAPRRDVSLQPHDLLMAVVLMLATRYLVSGLALFVFPDLKHGASDLSGREYALVQLLAEASHLPVVAFVIWRLTERRDGLTAFGLLSRHPLRDLAIGSLALITVMPIFMAVGVLVHAISTLWVEPPPVVQHEMLAVIRRTDLAPAIATMFLSAVLIAPIVEEIIYRGLVQTVLLDLGGLHHRWPVVLVSACWFTLVHQGVVSWQGLPGLFVLAISFGWLYERTGRLWPGMVLHVAFNAINFLYVLLMR